MAHILVVDDEPLIVEVLTVHLIAIGHRVISANSVTHGFELIKRHSPDLVLVDIMMPVGQPAGLDLLKQIKEHNRSIAVIIITGVASRQLIVAALRGGAQDFIEKPLQLDEVTKRVNKALWHQKTTWAY